MGTRGFSLIELLMATMVALVVAAAVVSVARAAGKAFAVELEAGDLQQRIRVATGTIESDLSSAGAGPYSGTSGTAGRLSGALPFFLAPVLPYRVGALEADPPGTFKSDTVTVFYVPATAAQTTLSAPITPGSLVLHVHASSGCPEGQPICGFTVGKTVLVHDNHGGFSTFVVTSSTGQLTVNAPGGVLHGSYAAGSQVVEVVQRTYQVKNDSHGMPQLVTSDGSANGDVAVADHIVDLQFEYYGDPQPPRLVKPLTEPTGPWTSYGPAPPSALQQPTAYPPGENCAFVFNAALEQHESRLAAIGNPANASTLVPLTEEALTDGPWCPDVAADGRYDADLLRVRSILVTLRVEAPDELRGPASPFFRRSGLSKDARHFVPDKEVRFQVTPSNMGMGR